ncbi:hypothetical protein AB1L30_20120 [Bremerella sp. JC817]|uniref:hypothetical protein n=1 Tax=Bremerella sp. JC817 TaxID=3231756 RepID=UPI0034587D0D
MSNERFDMVEHEEYLEYVISGDPSEKEWMDLLEDQVQHIQQTGKTKIYVDASGLTAPPVSMVRYRMGIRTGEQFGVHARVAVLRPTWEHDNFWETVATNRGAIARSGNDRDELIQWLLGGN